MIIAILLLSLAYIVSIIIILRGYYKDIAELEYRILQLEKRQNKMFKEVSEEDLEYLKKWDNEYKNWIFNPFEHGLNITSESFSKPKKKDNITQKECDCNMACKKGRGGKRK